VSARRAVSQMLLLPVTRVVALRPEIRRIIEEAYPRLAAELGALEQSARGVQPRSAAVKAVTEAARTRGEKTEVALDVKLHAADPVKLVDQMIDAADRRHATDIHVEPGEHEVAIRYRMDGLLYLAGRLPRDVGPALTSRVKILAQMDIAEHRVPQDGRFTSRREGGVLDLRVSSLPAQFGEKLVLRLLRKQTELLDLERLKMPVAVRAMHEDMISAPTGLFLVTGPTGSGKTTTLYATLNALDRATTNVVTLENPIEYSLGGITQVQINELTGMTFGAGLAAILRQDPDVILIGEIRDAATVETACRASLTGHKVLSTLHTSDAAEAVTRLVDMGVTPYLIAATVRGVLAQRLVRVICDQCREVYPATEIEIAILGQPTLEELQRGTGCDACDHTGYKGRLAIFEYLKIGDGIHKLIMDRSSAFAIRAAAQRNGMVPMSEFAKRAVLEGATTVAEIQRVVIGDEGKEQLCEGCQRVVSTDFLVCPFCQHVLKENCPSCRKPIASNWEACPGCGQEIEREWQRLYCRHCVAPIDHPGAPCPYCGGENG
jgi:type IV pilus assembly protein PilB